MKDGWECKESKLLSGGCKEVMGSIFSSSSVGPGKKEDGREGER